MNKSKKILWIGISTFILISLLLIIVMIMQNYVKDEYNNLSYIYLKEQKKNQLKDVINLIHIEANTILEAHYIEEYEELKELHLKISNNLKSLPVENFCTYLNTLEKKKHHTKIYIINHNNMRLCKNIEIKTQKDYLSFNKKEKEASEAIKMYEKLKFRTKELHDYRNILYSLLEFMEKRDSYTAGHTMRVARYCVLIAEAMQLCKKDINLLYEAAMLHDIGKIVTPDSILLKPGRLNNIEYKLMKEHLDNGYELLADLSAFEEHADIMRDHHESYDGSGYPRGVKEDEISILSHIMILADAFDAMTSARIYHKTKKTLQEAIDEITNLSAKQFSPEVVKHAVNVLAKNGVLTAHNQLPKTELEKSRFAYFFTDPLTGLYNYEYLEFVLHQYQVTNTFLKCGYFISVKNFSAFNNEFGWSKGNEKLCEIATELKNAYPDSKIFRIYGDDFLVANSYHQEIILDELKAFTSIDTTKLDVDLHHIDFHSIDNVDLLSKQVHDFIHLKL